MPLQSDEEKLTSLAYMTSAQTCDILYKDFVKGKTVGSVNCIIHQHNILYSIVPSLQALLLWFQLS